MQALLIRYPEILLHASLVLRYALLVDTWGLMTSLCDISVPGWWHRLRSQAAASARWGAGSTASTSGVHPVCGRGWWWRLSAMPHSPWVWSVRPAARWGCPSLAAPDSPECWTPPAEDPLRTETSKSVFTVVSPELCHSETEKSSVSFSSNSSQLKQQNCILNLGSVSHSVLMQLSPTCCRSHLEILSSCFQTNKWG